MRWSSRRRLLAAVASLAAAACSDSTEPSVPTSLTLSADSVSFVALGRTQQLTATVLDQTGAPMSGVGLTWTSSASGVATVTSTGLVTAAGNGTTAVTATAGNASAQAHVAVAQAPGLVVLTPDSVVLEEPGHVVQLGASVEDADGSAIALPTIAWSSSDESVATVDATGLVQAVAPGTAVVSADAGGALGQASVRVVPELTLEAAGPTALSAPVATEVTVSVRVEDLLGAAYADALVTWSADPGSGAITSSDSTRSDATGHAGAVWALGTLAGAQTARAQLTSRGNVIEVAFQAGAQPGPAATTALIADSILLSARGETAFLAPTHQDAHGNATTNATVTWVSREPAVASVATDGLVTGQAAGSTWVVGSVGAGSDSLLVTVIMRGAITVTFDDGFDTAYDNAFPVFQQLGLRGNIAVNPAQVGFAAYMSEAELDEVHAAGFSIVSHGMTHDSLTTLSVGELDWEVRASQEWIEARGYNGGNVFIVPFHDWAIRERNAIAGYYEATRGTSTTISVPDSLVSWRPSNPYDLTGVDADQLPFTTPAGRAELRDILQRTADEGAFVDVFFHNLPAVDVAAFEATMAIIDEFRDRVLPYHELYPRLARAVF